MKTLINHKTFKMENQANIETKIFIIDPESAAEKALSLLEKIDWALLKKQKAYLVSMSSHTKNDEREGLLNLIDSIQDFAVDTLGIDENEVFDLNQES